MQIRISLAPVVLVWRLFCALTVLVLCATGLGAVLLGVYGAFGYRREIVATQRVMKETAESLVTVRWTPRWGTWAFGGKSSEVVYHSSRNGFFTDSSGNRLGIRLGEKVQRMEWRWTALDKSKCLECAGPVRA